MLMNRAATVNVPVVKQEATHQWEPTNFHIASCIDGLPINNCKIESEPYTGVVVNFTGVCNFLVRILKHNTSLNRALPVFVCRKEHVSFDSNI
jgi:hypothetical protein